MNTRRLLYFLLIIVHITNQKVIRTEPALVITPVADLIGRPVKQSDMFVNYSNIPLASGAFQRGQLCPRVHQLIFNEIVDMSKKQCDEARINISSVYYLARNNANPQTAYWTALKNLIPLKTLKEKKVDLSKIPKPIEFWSNGSALYQKNTITLILPWTDRYSQQTFSAGTRFVLSKSDENRKNYSIYIFDPKIMNYRITQIPKKLALKNDKHRSNTKKTCLFVRLLRIWAHYDNGFIPYVWGGCSFTTTSKHPFEKKEYGEKGPGTYYFERPDIKCNPCIGLDCSGMVARAAQICGIPYFFKNSTTLASQMTPLKSKDTLQEGDLLWIPGHVMVIADTSKNTLIEARGYGSGYGRVHEIQLNKMFRNINTYGDLLKAYFAGKPLVLMNSKQENRSTLSDYKILKLASVWNQ